MCATQKHPDHPLCVCVRNTPDVLVHVEAERKIPYLLFFGFCTKLLHVALLRLQGIKAKI